jgi:nardilysin
MGLRDLACLGLQYDNFLSKHGGGSNAFTDTEFTCYHFEISPHHLQPALDRYTRVILFEFVFF